MAQVIAIINQKGGVGKSTTAQALSSGLYLKGYRTLAIDLDSQSNLTYSTGAISSGVTSLAILTGTPAEQAIQQTSSGDIIASHKGLASANVLLTDTGKEYRLRESLSGIYDKYDYIIIDTPPALGILTINALTASTGAIIPAQADIYSLQGIEQLGETIETIKKYTNKDLTTEGILLTRYNPRSILSREILSLAQKLAERLHTKVFKTTIREGIAIKEAQISQENIFKYAPKAKVTEDYLAFVNEFLQGKE